MNEGLGCNRNLEASQNRASRLRRPCRIGSKPLYQRQLMVLIRSRIESGPLPDPLFFITRTRLVYCPTETCADKCAGLARGAPPDPCCGAGFTQRPSDS